MVKLEVDQLWYFEALDTMWVIIETIEECDLNGNRYVAYCVISDGLFNTHLKIKESVLRHKLKYVGQLEK